MSVTISGLSKPETDENNGAGWTHSQNCKIPTVTKPPTISSHSNNSNNSNSATVTIKDSSTAANGTTSQQKNTSNDAVTISNNNTGGSSNPRRSFRQSTSNNSGVNSHSKHGTSKKSSSDGKYNFVIASAVVVRSTIQSDERIVCHCMRGMVMETKIDIIHSNHIDL